MPSHKGTIMVHGSCRIALECEEGDAAYAESVCATEELKLYKDIVDPADMTSLKKPTTEHEPVMKFKSADETKLVDFVPWRRLKRSGLTSKMSSEKDLEPNIREDSRKSFRDYLYD